LFSSGGYDDVVASAAFRLGAVKLTLAESDLAGGGGLTLVDERPSVLERHAIFLPADVNMHTHSSTTFATSSYRVNSKGVYSSCHVGSHSVTCHPTQVNVPHLNPSQASQYSIYRSWRDGQAELT